MLLSQHVNGEPINLPRDFLESRAEYQMPFGYESPNRLHANDGAYANEYWSWQGAPAPQTGRRHLEAQERRERAFDSFVTASPAMGARVARRLQEQAHRSLLLGAGGELGGDLGGAGEQLPEGQIMVGANCSAPACADQSLGEASCTTAEMLAKASK